MGAPIRFVGWMLAVLTAAALAGCAKPRVSDPICIGRCQRQNDACLLNATTAVAVQACQQETTACVHWCG